MFVIGGESLVDLVPEADGGYQNSPGGSPFNCAVALAKLGNVVGFLCPISEDPFGDILIETMASAGVVSLIKARTSTATTTATVEFDEHQKPRYTFRRGADLPPPSEALIRALPLQLDLLHIGGFAPLTAADAESWIPVIDHAIGRGATISMDINVRPSLIDDEVGYRRRLSEMLVRAHIVKLSEEDLAWLEPGLQPETYAAKLLGNRNCKLVVVTLGDKGSRAFSARASGIAGVYVPAVFGDTVGAGDNLMAGVLTSLDLATIGADALSGLDASDLDRILEFSAVVAGLNCAHRGCHPPTRAQVDEALNSI